ncbi:MAG: C40 family peptidase [Halomonas sp.]|uniref:Spr peptidase. Cysteine peptidase. MEROPS family C40 n=3 Tax=Vreelandella aquamarina TaxID=77097 RepID=A0A1H8HI67_9GAMM|nr:MULTISPECIES: NlpC/P60 family protein [Halomonas]MAD21236.1 glycoside hydrolase [Halomonas sp.]MEE3267652.1 NlpC/P60 family protein [Pseudomonadota bacterium]SEN55228.1 spr peptidase. Cysteine peptidase. MEROPS family C40 [Halomonas aquamarina]MCD1650453.1 C40 family peptidase [Halomonas axialensis]MCD2087410.1 C40 family peptidase [Halomonas meridiana]
MVASPHPAVTAVRVVSVCVVVALLAGCAGSASRQDMEAPEDYFSMSLPGMEGVTPQMSPVDPISAHLRNLQTPPPTVVRQALLEQHQRWAGTPYRIGGTTDRGIDCSALVRNVFRDTFDVELPRSTQDQVHEGRPIDRQELQAGDLVFFRPPGRYNHVGIYVGNGYFLHASTSKGVIISSLDNSYWQRYYWQSRRALEPTNLAQLSSRYTP